MFARQARYTLVLVGLLAAAAPAWAQQQGYYERDGAFRLRMGLFTPDGESEYWTGKELEFTGEAADLENIVVGTDYLLTLSPWTGVLFSGSFFEGDTTQSYIGFEDNFGDRIRHDTTLDLGTFTAAFVFQLAGEEVPIRPYLGFGGGLYVWRLEESGDFIDLDTLEIFDATLESDGAVLGYFGVAGVEVPLGRSFSLLAEGRWHQAEDELSGDFEDFGTIDLSGLEITAGLSWSM
ncbi:MAG TPA: hypothetical protein VMW27_12505 [Thermoanaerobaculia bacterium]|nr:hypothetical protein [Thermoanaerobaculia bacterium]